MANAGISLDELCSFIGEKHGPCSRAFSSKICQKPRGLDAGGEEGRVGCFVLFGFFLC